MENKNGEGLSINLKVLLVEDEEFAREELSRFLKRRVGKLYIASNGMEGLKIIEEQSPDCVITDLKMPYMSGLEMASKARIGGYNAPIIVISALSDSETILNAVDIGIVKYIVKPVDTKQLVDTMELLASNILRDKFNQTVLNETVLISKDEKQKLEQKIKSEVAAFIKNHTGKGPKNVHVLIQGNNVEIKAEGVLTLLELNLISHHRNNGLVDYNRRLFYMENKEVFEHSIESVIGSKVNLVKIECDSKLNLDSINFLFL